MNLSKHRDPFGLTAKQAIKEAELLFNKHPRFKAVYGGDRISVRATTCPGQHLRSGRKSTSGCFNRHLHLQPCPGGPIIYSIVRTSTGLGLPMNCIEATASSWREAIDGIIKRREEEHKRYAT